MIFIINYDHRTLGRTANVNNVHAYAISTTHEVHSHQQ